MAKEMPTLVITEESAANATPKAAAASPSPLQQGRGVARWRLSRSLGSNRVLRAAAGLAQIPTEIVPASVPARLSGNVSSTTSSRRSLSAPCRQPTCRTTSRWKICTGRCPRWGWSFRPVSGRNTWGGILVTGDVAG